MLVDVEAFEQAVSRHSEFFLSESFWKSAFERCSGRRFSGLGLDNRDAAAGPQNRSQVSKVFDAVLNVVICIDQQYQIEACGR